MIFLYPGRPHERKHGPSGYQHYERYKDWLRDEFAFRCVYCLEREVWYPSGAAAFGIDHVKPKSHPDFRDLESVYENLVDACNRCNSAKQDEMLLDPCKVALGDHLRVHDDGKIEGLTQEGKDLVDSLGLDQPRVELNRLQYLRIMGLHRQYPNDPEIRALYLQAFGFPDDLPNLEVLKPPGGNSRPDGLRETYWKQKAQGRLPETY